MSEENEHAYSIQERRKLIYEFLLENSNEDHVVATQRIKDYLSTFGIKTSINTLYNDIDEIEFMHKVVIEYDNKKKGYQLKDTLFKPYEIRIIAHSIESSKLISEKNARDLIEKLKTLTDRYTASSLHGDAFVFDRIHSLDDTLLNGADRLYQAIAEDKQIMFKSFRYVPNKDHPKKYDKNGSLITVSPYKLVWHNGNLLLLAYLGGGDDRFVFYRVDRLESIKRPLYQKREGKEQYKQFMKKLKTVKASDMVDVLNGKLYDVKIHFHESHASEVIDRFGKDIMMIPDKTGFTITQPVFVSRTFLSWIASFEGKAKILWPDEVKKEMAKFSLSSQFSYRKKGEELIPQHKTLCEIQEKIEKEDGET